MLNFIKAKKTEINMKEQGQVILNYLAEINDPEIPVINIVELGIVKSIENRGDEVTVEITPTYSGCPAMRQIESDIISKLNSKGFSKVTVSTVYSPVWTTDFMSDETKSKLKNYGIAPPGKSEDSNDDLFSINLQTIICPFCNSDKTEIRSPFGSTACKSVYYCDNCHQPFEHFKCI